MTNSKYILITIVLILTLGAGFYFYSMENTEKQTTYETNFKKDISEKGTTKMTTSSTTDNTDTTSQSMPVNEPKVAPSATEVQKPAVTTASGLQIQDLLEGTGEAVKSGDTISINYKGTLLDGTKFDSSYDRGTPFETQIGVGRVIAGWDEGVVGMKVGGKRKLIIPANLAYGARAIGSIPANSTLIFEVELMAIK